MWKPLCISVGWFDFVSVGSVLYYPHLVCGFIAGILQGQVHHGVLQSTAHVKLQGEVVDALQENRAKWLFIPLPPDPELLVVWISFQLLHFYICMQNYFQRQQHKYDWMKLWNRVRLLTIKHTVCAPWPGHVISRTRQQQSNCRQWHRFTSEKQHYKSGTENKASDILIRLQHEKHV